VNLHEPRDVPILGSQGAGIETRAAHQKVQFRWRTRWAFALSGKLGHANAETTRLHLLVRDRSGLRQRPTGGTRPGRQATNGHPGRPVSGQSPPLSSGVRHRAGRGRRRHIGRLGFAVLDCGCGVSGRSWLGGRHTSPRQVVWVDRRAPIGRARLMRYGDWTSSRATGVRIGGGQPAVLSLSTWFFTASIADEEAAYLMSATDNDRDSGRISTNPERLLQVSPTRAGRRTPARCCRGRGRRVPSRMGHQRFRRYRCRAR
jgi:hypothetical protein